MGEHIPKQYERQFLDTITEKAAIGVVLSWAVPGQDGVGHVNCQTNDYVKGKMRERGFVFDVEATAAIRVAATAAPWVKHTIMVFRRKQRHHGRRLLEVTDDDEIDPNDLLASQGNASASLVMRGSSHRRPFLKAVAANGGAR